MVPSGSQYFAPVPAVASDPRSVEVVLPDTSFRMTTDRGVFSAGRLDTGTRLLLLDAPPPAATGHLLDLGCGAGPMAITLARRAPAATVWAIDVNTRARELTAANATASGVTNVRVAHPHEVPEDVTFATIWSNPPIRIGKAALHELLGHWLDRLDPQGEAVLVVQRHLGADSLARWLGQRGHRAQRLGSRAGYRLLGVGPARSDARRVDDDPQA